MSEVEEEDVDEREREDQEEGSVQMHLLQGRVTVARYNWHHQSHCVCKTEILITVQWCMKYKIVPGNLS